MLALLLHWESDDLFVLPELEDLDQCLHEDYNFDTETYAIPSEDPQLDLTLKVASMIKKYKSRDTLFLIYYGGHGIISDSRQSIWKACVVENTLSHLPGLAPLPDSASRGHIPLSPPKYTYKTAFPQSLLDVYLTSFFSFFATRLTMTLIMPVHGYKSDLTFSIPSAFRLNRTLLSTLPTFHATHQSSYKSR